MCDRQDVAAQAWCADKKGLLGDDADAHAKSPSRRIVEAAIGRRHPRWAVPTRGGASCEQGQARRTQDRLKVLRLPPRRPASVISASILLSAGRSPPWTLKARAISPAALPNHPHAGNAQYWLGDSPFVRGQYRSAAGAFRKGYKTMLSACGSHHCWSHCGSGAAALRSTPGV
jgi:hypothetical protein